MEKSEKCKCSATGKRRYDSLGEALNNILAFKHTNRYKNNISKKRTKKRKGKNSLKRAYFCSSCNGYHITSMTVYRKKEEKKVSNLVCKASDYFVRKWKEDSLPFPIKNI